MAKTRVSWLEEKTFIGLDGEGHSAVMSSRGGPGISPMRMLLLGLGGCTLYDVVNILQKQRQALHGVDIEVDGERAEEPPKAWETIHLHYIFRGSGLDPKRVAKAIDLSVEKYCGAHATIAGVATITHDFEIRESGEAETRRS